MEVVIVLYLGFICGVLLCAFLYVMCCVCVYGLCFFIFGCLMFVINSGVCVLGNVHMIDLFCVFIFGKLNFKCLFCIVFKWVLVCVVGVVLCFFYVDVGVCLVRL